jgi:hypothetical protein
MKKYRLIKNYPGCSWTLNSICSNDFIWDNGKKVYLKNYPEFWEEVIEKDYEILSLLLKKGYTYKVTKVDLSNSRGFIEALLNCYNNRIYSIKRLSDGKIFTLGDIIRHNNNVAYPIGELTKITIVNDTLFFESNRNYHGFNVNMCFISKVQQPLFITEDGFPIYQGDTYCCVNTAPHLWSIFQQTAKEKTILNKTVIAFKSIDLAQKYIDDNKPKVKLFTTEDGVDIFENDEVWGITKNVWKPFYRNAKLNNKIVTETWFHGKFSTKEKAEEYILMNKPCLSINDFLSVSYFTVKSKTRTIKRLKKLINSKL